MLTYEVLRDDGTYVGDFGCRDVLAQVLQEDSLAQVVFSTECIVDTPKEQITEINRSHCD